MNFINRYIFPFFLLSICFLFFWANYSNSTFLTGWDNLHPEFNFGLNLKRSIFAVWQEYQGLGLLGGMAHASDLIHVLQAYILSLVFPINMVRYIWTFLMLFVGSLGIYFFLKKIFFFTDQNANLKSFLGALFYLLNLSTIQTFYAPFEPFSAHFAALPWLLLSSFNFLNNPKKKNILFLAVILLLSTPHAYVPTLFVVYLLIIFIYIGIKYFLVENKRKLLSVSTKLLGIITLVNGFWLFPFIYFTLMHSSVNINSKINQMATQTVFSQNKEFGNLTNVIQLKGFWFQNIDPNMNGDFSYMLLPLRNYYSNSFVIAVGFLFFALILFGLFWAVKTRDKSKYPFIVLFIFVFTMLATNTPPFSWIDIIFRKLPLINQAFRFPFTKFSILASFMYAIFFAYGISILIDLSKKFLHSLTKHIFTAVAVFLLVVYAFPVFTGNLFYSKARIEIPNEYFQVFNYFKTQDKNSRIANFPQHTFWGWNYYRWGYGGSGFLWYGIEQPILDRAFDVWSHESEQYYFELSDALYSKNVQSLKNVFDKYQIEFLLVDKNVIYPPAPKSLFFPETEALLTNIPGVTKVKSFGDIDIYRTNSSNRMQKFIYFAKNVNSYTAQRWTNRDVFYQNLGTYIASDNTTTSYPFSSLFSKKTEAENGVKITEGENDYKLSTTLPPRQKDINLKIPSYPTTQHVIPVQILLQKSQDGVLFLQAKILTPNIYSSSKKIWGQSIQVPLFLLPKPNVLDLKININGGTQVRIPSVAKDDPLVTTFFSLNQDNYVTVSDSQNLSQTYVLKQNLLLDIIKEEALIILPASKQQTTLEILFPKITDSFLSFETDDFSSQNVKSCDNFRQGKYSHKILSEGKSHALQLTSQNSTLCMDFYLPNLIHNEGYVVFAQSKTTKGRGLHFWILNEDEKIAPLDTYIAGAKTFQNHNFVLAPMEPNGKGYSLHFENISIGKDLTENIIKRVAVFNLPYDFVTEIQINDKLGSPSKSEQSSIQFSTNHPNESLYNIDIHSAVEPNTTVVLSQSYDVGWKAYTIQNSELRIKNWLNTKLPFFFGKQLEHVKINNWENGWVIDSSVNQKSPARNASQRDAGGSIIIIYLPQYLEYFGFILLAVGTCYLIFSPKRNKSSNP
ncbi:MAG: hypothetical protein COX79_03745 [Candidatus Levybacteria bacterium CG_4_10_14_0_2_um_filter_36_16]|nr:MAG: hypothetical protein AUK12_01900 [Candidatus Levybacteria bacterium CG2_30_37_29]PIZ97038.1 MAG: hypothetical protein COX79_03745 [Candidatus Levybacteria bacterium CG_4_10_14_0_2_um_filter_36_16]